MMGDFSNVNTDFSSIHSTDVISASSPSNDSGRTYNITRHFLLNLDNLYPEQTPAGSSYHWFEHILLIVCSIGLIGNSLNLFVLTRRRFRTALNNLECSANYGLVALAVSDLCYCFVVLPHALLPGLSNYIENDRNLVLVICKLYGIALINLFQMTSTWIIVIIAINRWIVVKYPIKAKRIIGRKGTMYSIMIVCTACILVSSPYFMMSAIGRSHNGLGFDIYYLWNDDIIQGFSIYFRWIWPIVANFIPLLTLVWTNVSLVIQIRKAMRQDEFNVGRRLNSHKAAESKVTITLISIVVMYFIFGTPAEIVRYVDPYSRWGNEVGIAVAKSLNLLQAVNFAFNFLLYCAVNMTFRQTFKEMIRPRRRLPSYRTNDDIKTLQTLISQRFMLRSGSSVRSSAMTI